MLREIKGTQRLSRLLALKITGTGTAAIGEGVRDATLVDNGTGDYTLTFLKPFVRSPVVTVTTLTANTRAEVSAASVSACTIKIKDDAQVATDGVFFVLVLGWDATDTY
jgi:hypothetical protein